MTVTATHPTTRAQRRAHAVPGARDAYLKALEDAAQWLRDHPDAPVSRWGSSLEFSPGSVAEVRRIAGELGIEVEDCPSLVRAVKRFGPVAYVLKAATAEVPQ